MLSAHKTLHVQCITWRRTYPCCYYCYARMQCQMGRSATHSQCGMHTQVPNSQPDTLFRQCGMTSAVCMTSGELSDSPVSGRPLPGQKMQHTRSASTDSGSLSAAHVHSWRTCTTQHYVASAPVLHYILIASCNCSATVVGDGTACAR